MNDLETSIDLMPHGHPPKNIWLIFPDDGGEAVLWTKLCPFPVDDGTIVKYEVVPRSSMAEQ